MNMFALLQKPKNSSRYVTVESPLEIHAKNNFFPPDRYIREEQDGHSLLKFRDRSTGKSFYLEIKSCRCDWMHQIQWCTEIQLRKYVSCHKKTPMFFLLDIENDDKSHAYYLLSMTQARHAHLVDTNITHCKIDAHEPVTSNQLWSR